MSKVEELNQALERAERLAPMLGVAGQSNSNVLRMEGSGGVVVGVGLGLAIAAFIWVGWQLSEERQERRAVNAELVRRMDRFEDYQSTVYQLIPELREKVIASSPKEE